MVRGEACGLEGGGERLLWAGTTCIFLFFAVIYILGIVVQVLKGPFPHRRMLWLFIVSLFLLHGLVPSLPAGCDNRGVSPG